MSREVALLLLGAFIGAAAAWYFAVARARKGELSEEAADRIWHSIVGDRDVRTSVPRLRFPCRQHKRFMLDALTEHVH